MTPRTGFFQIGLFVLVLALAQGCGSSGAPESSSERTSPPSRSAEPSPAGETTRAGDTTGKQAAAPARRGEGGARHRQPQSETSPTNAAQANPKRAAGNSSSDDVSCPGSYTRSQCAADAAAGEEQAPSYAVSQPRDCLRAMSRAECKKLIEAELAAKEADGESFRPEECLDNHTRQECEAIFEAMGQAPK